jgi:acyl-CoA hydrolase
LYGFFAIQRFNIIQAGQSRTDYRIRDIFTPMPPITGQVLWPLKNVESLQHLAFLKIGGCPQCRIGENPRGASIAGLVETNQPDEGGTFSAIGGTTALIEENAVAFLASEFEPGCIPAGFLPIQSGVGDTANAVLNAMGARPKIPTFDMYTELIQDAVVALVRVTRFASTAFDR